MKKIKLLCMLISCVLLIASCGVSGTDEMASINDKSISRDQFNFYLMQGKNSALSVAYQMGNQIASSEDWKNVKIGDVSALEYAKEQAEYSLKQTLVLLEKAKDFGIEITDEDKEIAQNNKNSMIEQLGGRTQFKQFLEEYDITEEIFDAELKNNILAGNVYAKLTEEGSEYVKIDDEAISKKYEEEYMAAKHILILTDSSNATEDVSAEMPEKNAKDKADDILDKIKSGHNFDELMNEFTEDPGLEQSPNGYVFTSGDMVPEFENAVKSLNVGDYTDKPVQTSYGYHIIKRIALPLDGDEYDKAIDTIKSMTTFEQIDVLIDNWSKEYKFKLNKTEIDKIKF